MKIHFTKKVFVAIFVILSFFCLRFVKYFWGYVIYTKGEWNALDIDLRTQLIYYSQIVFVLIVTSVLFRKQPLKFLGLNKDIVSGLVAALLFTMPMILGFGIKSGFLFDLNFQQLQKAMVYAGFYEELVYRGFLFGLLYFYCGWGFLTATLLPSVFFGLGHIYQAESFQQGIGIFIFTFLVNIGFAWFYVAWKSLWMAIFLHGFMDLSWDMFNIEANVIGNGYANIFRALTIFLAVFYSIKQAKKNQTYSLKGKLWRNPDSYSF